MGEYRRRSLDCQGGIGPIALALRQSQNQIREPREKENDMRVPVILPVFVCILFAASFAFAHDVHVDYDHNADFSKYRTFMWVEKPETNDPLIGDRIVDS